jgi:putative membrane protein
MRTLSILLALIGVGVALLLLTWFDIGDVWTVTTSIGWGGFALLLLLQAGLFLLLASAWCVVMPAAGLRLILWGRMVRDAATTCLPFSPVGGYVIGARAITLQGLPWPTAAAGTVVDVTAEIAAQLLFALFGVAVILLVRPGAGFVGPLAAGVVAALGMLVLGVWQRARIGTVLRSLGARLLGDWFNGRDSSTGGVEQLQRELGRMSDPRRLAAASMVHLSGWFATGLITWISLRLLGAHTDVVPVIALEALLDALVAAAFVVPGAAGVQEAGYVGIGALFGVPPDLALSLSLLRRAKDLAWGIPILLAWQWREVRRLAMKAVR